MLEELEMGRLFDWLKHCVEKNGGFLLVSLADSILKELSDFHIIIKKEKIKGITSIRIF